MQCGDDGRRILVDHREQSAGWRFWRAASAFPMLDRIKTEAKVSEKRVCVMLSLLRMLFHIDFIRDVNLEAFPLSCEKGLNFVQSDHELCKRDFRRNFTS
jgi:hypothetical protein